MKLLFMQDYLEKMRINLTVKLNQEVLKIR